MGKFCLENYFVIELCSARGFPLEEASELGFLSIKVSFLVLLFSIFFLSTVFIIIILVSSLHNTSGTLQVVSEHFPLHKF
jgi:hypothetical protein